MAHPVGRRRILAGGGATLLAAGLGGCAATVPPPKLVLAPPRASVDRISQITVCTRPFRPLGPRLEVETIGDQTIVHNYGHGGSGWSLSWGSGELAVRQAMATGQRDLGVIGCGALGLTAALLAQRAGARVTIYARELPPNVRSSLASGVWTPDSRICFADNATLELKQRWQFMCRRSFQTYQSLLGLAGNPVEAIDLYYVADNDQPRRREPPGDRPAFADLQRELVPEQLKREVEFPAGSHSLGPRTLWRGTTLMFNISSYSRLLLNDYLSFGGKIEIREFHSPAEFAGLPHKTLINCTGYGARDLFGDRSLVPVRGQLARMMPQAEIDYGLFYRRVSFLPRRDGLVFQQVGDNDYYGFGDDGIAPDLAEAESAVTTIAGLFTA